MRDLWASVEGEGGGAQRLPGWPGSFINWQRAGRKVQASLQVVVVAGQRAARQAGTRCWTSSPEPQFNLHLQCCTRPLRGLPPPFCARKPPPRLMHLQTKTSQTRTWECLPDPGFNTRGTPAERPNNQRPAARERERARAGRQTRDKRSERGRTPIMPPPGDAFCCSRDSPGPPEPPLQGQPATRSSSSISHSDRLLLSPVRLT
jgi:hypothetical protein